MAHLFSGRHIGWTILFAFCCSILQAQDLKPDQEKICQRYNESRPRCLQLVAEFADHELVRTNHVPSLDSPIGDTKTWIHKVAVRALLLQIQAGLKDKASEAAQTALQTISTSAATNQNGGAPTASGSTNLVSKPTTTDFISMAAESGAFTDSINGTTMTLQANALGLTKYFTNNPVFERWNSRAADKLQPLTLTASLNIAQTGSTTANTAGSANAATPTSIASVLLPTHNASFSSFGASYAVYRPYNPQDPKFLKSWTAALAANQTALDAATKKIEAVETKLFANDLAIAVANQTSNALTQWHTDGSKAEIANDFDAFVQAFSKYEDAYSDTLLAGSPDAPKEVLELSQAVDAFGQVVYDVLDKARGTPLATVSYLYSNPQDKPATHSFTAVISYLFKGDDPKKRTPLTGAQLTANFTTSIYASLPVGAAYGRLRDFQLSGEFDKPFGGTPDEPRGTWSLAAYGQYQYDPTVLNITAGNLVPGTNIPLPGDAQVLLGTAGWLGVAQGKLTINLKKGLSIPVALKWSNKTDLLKGNDVRGQVGLSYDLSALDKLIAPSKN
ncbi:MAG TPA: hypothetical protein VGK24_18180 [Candidatus Angelobacter sp.]|jgi:hypothetical protein